MSDSLDSTNGVHSLDRAQIKSASARGLAVSGVAQIGRFGVQFFTSVMMARLLLPADFGLVAMAAPLVAFVQLLADLGLTQATVQRSSISQKELSFLFWIGVATSVTIGAAVIAAAPLVGKFYNEPKVSGIVLALGAIVMMGGASAQHNALLNRSLRFGALAAVDLGGLLCGSIAGVIAAWSGWSYWAIIFAQAVTSIVALTLSWLFSKWVPSAPSRIESGRELLGFGSNVTTFNIVNFFARNLDNVLIGKFSGEAQLGLYDRAYKLLLFPLGQITAPVSRIANPILARSLSEPLFYRQAYLRLLDAILLMTFPLAIFSGINNLSLITIVLGAQWRGAAPVFAVLSVGALFAPISNSTSWLLITQGRGGELRNYGMLSSLAFVLSFIIGLKWGPLGVAIAYISVGVVQGPIIWWATTRRGPVSLSDLLRNLKPYVIASLPVAAFNCGAMIALKPSILSLAILFTGSYVVFALSMVAIPSGRRILQPVFSQIKNWVNSLSTWRSGYES